MAKVRGFNTVCVSGCTMWYLSKSVVDKRVELGERVWDYFW